jgi:translocation and assembly module TamA
LRRTTAISKTLVVAVLVAGCAVASGLGLTRTEGDAEPGAAVAQDLRERVNYTVSVTGVEGELLDLMQRSSLLQELIDRPPPTLGGIVRRAETDQERFVRVLRSRGYY